MSKTEKLIAKLLNEHAAFTWQELETLLCKLGYQPLEGQGARIKFHNGDPQAMINLALIHSPPNTMQNGWFCTPPFELARRWVARWGRIVSGPSGAMDGGRRAPMDGSSASRTSLPHAGLPERRWAVNGSPPSTCISHIRVMNSRPMPSARSSSNYVQGD